MTDVNQFFPLRHNGAVLITAQNAQLIDLSSCYQGTATAEEIVRRCNGYADIKDALRRAIQALNCTPAFMTNEGVSSYKLIPQLETIMKG